MDPKEVTYHARADQIPAIKKMVMRLPPNTIDHVIDRDIVVSLMQSEDLRYILGLYVWPRTRETPSTVNVPPSAQNVHYDLGQGRVWFDFEGSRYHVSVRRPEQER